MRRGDMKNIIILMVTFSASFYSIANNWNLILEQSFKDAHKNESGKYALHLFDTHKKKIKAILFEINKAGEVLPIGKDLQGFEFTDIDVIIGGHKINFDIGNTTVKTVSLTIFKGPFAVKETVFKEPAKIIVRCEKRDARIFVKNNKQLVLECNKN